MSMAVVCKRRLVYLQGRLEKSRDTFDCHGKICHWPLVSRMRDAAKLLKIREITPVHSYKELSRPKYQ